MLVPLRASDGVGGVRVYWGLQGSVDTLGQKGYVWHQGALGAPRGVGGHHGIVMGHQGVYGCQGCI